MKFKDGGRPETPWVLNAIKLFTHMNGSEDSMCWKYMYGNDTKSMRNSEDIEVHDIHVPAAKTKTLDLEFI